MTAHHQDTYFLASANVNACLPAEPTREQQEAVQCRVFDWAMANDDRWDVMAALFQPPRDVHTNDMGKRLYGRTGK